MRIQYQFELASGLCALELDVVVRDNLFQVTAGGYTSPAGTGEQLEAAILDYIRRLKQARAQDVVDGRILRNLPLSPTAQP